MGTPIAQSMKAITLRQPWASLVLEGLQDVINVYEPTDYRGELLVHAGRKRTPWGPHLSSRFGVLPRRLALNLPFAQMLGVVNVVDCLKKEDCKSRWAYGAPYALVVKNPRKLKLRFRCSGAIGLWDCKHPALKKQGILPSPITTHTDKTGQSWFL